MRYITLLFLLTFLTNCYSQNITKLETTNIHANDLVDSNWAKSYQDALKQSKRKNKLVLIFFTGSDWCGPCKMLVEDFFATPKFKDTVKKDFIMYEADFPRRKDLVSADKQKANNMLSKKYGVNTYPTIIVTDSNGNRLGNISGYTLLRETDMHYAFLERMIQQK